MTPPNDLLSNPKPDRAPTAEEAALIIAQAAQANAEARKAANEADDAANTAAISRLALQQQERDVADLLAGDNYHCVYRFTGGIDESSVKLAIDRLTAWHRMYPHRAMQIIFTSEGGNVTEGMALFDYITFLIAEGHEITTSVSGAALSMAGILLQAGSIRTMGPEAWLMLHEASFRAQGNWGEMKDTVGWVEQIIERILRILATRSTMTIEEIRAKWDRTNWWLSSDMALAKGFVDVVR